VIGAGSPTAGDPCWEGRLRIRDISLKDVVLSLVSLALVGAGVILIATFFFPGAPRDTSASGELQNFNVPILKDTQSSAGKTKEPETASEPQDKTLWLTVPKMARISGAIVPSAAGNDEAELKDYAAIHLEDTGFPWESGANVYIAGHRLGYPDSASFLAFYDLDSLEQGDEITIADANGKVYTYKVSRQFVASPTDLSVTGPVEGKDILTLQTCTLPDYSQRLIVQAEKVV
jgi:sortase A